MTRAWSCCLAALLLFGCTSRKEPVRGVRPVFEPAHTEAQRFDRQAPADTPRPQRSVEMPEASVTQEPERDLSDELLAAVGLPLECVRDFTAPRPTEIRISVSAVVRPTGMVITPSAYGAGLSATARECIERRVSAVVLKPLDEPVSERVSAVIVLDYEPETIVESSTGVPEPRLPDVREPLPKRPAIPLDAKFISGWPTDKWISGGFDGGVKPSGPEGRKIEGPKPRAIDGYDVDENAQIWR